MTNPSAEPHGAPPTQHGHGLDSVRGGAAARRLSPRTQSVILAAAVGVIVVLWLIFGLVAKLFAPHEAAPVAETPGVFKPTAGQWANLTLAEARQTDFHPGVETDGQVAANDDHTTQVFSPFTGRITKVFVAAGDRVAKGQPLYAIAASEFVQGQSDLGVAVAGLAAARTQLANAQANAARQQELLKVSGASQKDAQQSQADLATAQSNLRTAEAALASARARARILGENDAQIAAQEKAPAGKGADAETVVRAPISGIVTQRAAGVGQVVSTPASGAGTALFSISDLSTVWLVANVREADAAAMKLGAPIEARTLAFPDKVFQGRVRFVAPVIDPNTRRLTVRAEIANPGMELRPQMFAQMTVGTGSAQVGIAIPEGAVLYEGETARAWVARADKTLTLRPIKVGAIHDGLVEVVSGLTPGERVVNGGSLFIDNAAKGD
jgi:cobalt-zinc-cadmium efflux system membrane fusion protein